jgi:hypothetical protein
MTDERNFEIASLLPDKWYIILTKVDDDNFRMTAYDTTRPPQDEDDEFVDAGFVAQQGIIELLENDFERLLQAGLARIHFNGMKEEILEELEEEGIDLEPKDRVTERDKNVLKVDFGTKQ